MMPGLSWLMRWALVFAAATAGSWAGRLVAAALYEEDVAPLLRLDRRTLLSQDVAPGFLAAEVLGRNLHVGPTGEVVLAALAGASSAVATGPMVSTEARVLSGPTPSSALSTQHCFGGGC